MNSRTRFIFDDYPVRGLHIQLQEVWQHIVQQKNYPLPIQQALGELLGAGALFAGNLKQEGTLILQIQGQGILKMLVVESNSDNTCRATARWDETAHIPPHATLKELLGDNSIFALTFQPKNAEAWQGIVPLEGDNIAQMLMEYTKRSEQLDTIITLSANDQTVSGLLLQKLPAQELDNEQWDYFTMLAQTVSATELLTSNTQQLLYRLFHETPPRVFPADELEFACTCSRGKISDLLLMLGGEEVSAVVAEQGSITINCDFCHQSYSFDETDVNGLFGTDVVHLNHPPTPLQ